MHRPLPRLLLCAALLPATLIAACGDDDPEPASTPGTTPATTAVTETSTTLPVPSSATKNTVRVDGADTASIAAISALMMYPGTSEESRPEAVAIAGADDWRAVLLASSFAAKPLGFPLLLTNGREMPAVSKAALKQLKPTGSSAMNGAEAVRVAVLSQQGDLKSRSIEATTPASLSRQVDRQLTKLRGRPASRVLIVNSEDAASAAPAAAWAARSGDPILFVGAGQLPADTKAALQSHENPRIYVMGGPEVVSRFVISQLQELGTVRRISPESDVGGAADLAIAFAKYSDGDMGFNFRDSGHGLVFASTKSPISAMAASALSSGGTYGALLYVDRADRVEPALRSYLLDIQPGYNDDNPPTLGIYNRGWIIGDQEAIATKTQARIDSLLEIVRTESTTQSGPQTPTPGATP